MSNGSTRVIRAALDRETCTNLDGIDVRKPLLGDQRRDPRDRAQEDQSEEDVESASSLPLESLAVLEVGHGHLQVGRRALGLVDHLDRTSLALQRAPARVEPTAPAARRAFQCRRPGPGEDSRPKVSEPKLYNFVGVDGRRWLTTRRRSPATGREGWRSRARSGGRLSSQTDTPTPRMRTRRRPPPPHRARPPPPTTRWTSARRWMMPPPTPGTTTSPGNEGGAHAWTSSRTTTGRATTTTRTTTTTTTTMTS